MVTAIVVLVALEHVWFLVLEMGCVVVAGVFGAITVSRRIFWIQALPALVGLAWRA